MIRDSFVFYRSFYEACKELDPEDFKAAIMAICGYAFDGEEPKVSGVPKALFTMAKPIIDTNNKRYENGKKGGRPKTETEPNTNQTKTKAKPNNNQMGTKPEPNVNVNVNDNVNVNIKEKGISLDIPKEKRRTAFSPPTLEQVQAYCLERHNRVDPQHFIDYYESQRWKKANGQPLSDWKAAVRTWEAKDRERKTANKFNAFEMRENNFSDIEAKMMRRGLAQ